MADPEPPFNQLKNAFITIFLLKIYLAVFNGNYPYRFFPKTIESFLTGIKLNITMRKVSQISKLMHSELPSYGYQKRLSYRTNLKEVAYLYKLLNKEVFNNKLPQAELRVMNKTPGYWGYCIAKNFTPYETGSTCLIKLSEKWYCKQWLITTLAHEMVHQYQFDIDGPKRMKRGLEPIMSHGPSFFIFRDRLEKFGISLKKSHSRKRWLIHQNLFKC